MSLYASRRCLDIAGRVTGSNSLPRTWSLTASTLVLQRRCYASPAAAQKSKTKPASASSSTSRPSGKAQNSKDEKSAKDRTTEDELKSVEALYRMSETNEVDVSSAPLDLMGELRSILVLSLFVDHGNQMLWSLHYGLKRKARPLAITSGHSSRCRGIGCSTSARAYLLVI